MAIVAIVCVGCSKVNGDLAGPAEAWKCGGCGAPLRPVRKNESARLNLYGYSASPALCNVLDSVTRTR